MHANDDHEILKKRQPIPRLVKISEIVDALLYLESAPMANGENIRIQLLVMMDFQNINIEAWVI
jgi:hypothetical protein